MLAKVTISTLKFIICLIIFNHIDVRNNNGLELYLITNQRGCSIQGFFVLKPLNVSQCTSLDFLKAGYIV